MPHRNFLRTCLLMCLIITLAACRTDDPKPTPTPVPRASVKLITVTPQLYLAGYFGAASQNYFDRESLDAELIFTNSTLEQGDSDVLTQVVAGQGEFGIASADQILQARQQGMPVVAIASVYQRDPTAIIALKAKNITTPSDLKGKKILIWTYETIFRLFASTVGLDMNDVTLVFPPGGSIAQGSTLFITGQVDAMVANGTDTIVQMTAAGIQVDTVFFNDYGVANYPNVLFTTEDMIQNQPNVVQRFVSAFVSGLQYAVDNPDAMGTWYIDNYGDLLLPQQRTSGPQVMQAIVPLIHPSDNEPGVMIEATWQFVYDAMLTANLLEPSDVTAAYTRKFVNAYYKND